MVYRREDRNKNDTNEHHDTAAAAADNHYLAQNKYAASVYNLSVHEKNVLHYKAEIKRLQKALKKFSSEGQKQRLKSQLLHYKSELEKSEREMTQLRKAIDRRARAMSSSRKTKADVETWEAIATYAKLEIANQQQELVAMQEELMKTKEQIVAVRAASNRISEELFEEDDMVQDSGCCVGVDSYFGALSTWFVTE